MKTIDELLDGVAKNLGVNPKPSVSAPKQNPPVPVKTVKTQPAEQKTECAAVQSVSKEQIAKAISATPVPNRENLSEYTKKLTLNFAKEIAYCIEIGAKTMGVNVCISVCNPQGNPILMNAMDESYIVSPKASQDKAYTAAALKMPTHQALEMTRQGGALDGLTNGDGILLLGGGYPLEADGEIFGGVGVSGGTKDQDAALALLGLVYFRARRAAKQ